MTELRPVKPWVFWAILYTALWAALAASCICAILAYQMIVVKGQNEWSIEDRGNLHQRLDEQAEMLRRWDVIIKNEQARQERRKAEAKK